MTTSQYSSIKPSNTSMRKTTTDGKIVIRSSEMEDGVGYEVWEPAKVMNTHYVLQHFDGKLYGRLVSRFLPPEIEAMKGGSPERIAACDARKKALLSEAIDAILATYAEAYHTRSDAPEEFDAILFPEYYSFVNWSV